MKFISDHDYQGNLIIITPDTSNIILDYCTISDLLPVSLTI